MSNLKKPSVDWFFLLQWVLATTIGSIIGLSGIGSGILQWLVLRQRIPRAGWWILATIVGNSLAFLAIGFVGLGLSGGGGGTAGGIIFVSTLVIGGAFIGILQWLVLRRYVFRASWWILASTLSFTLSFYIELIIAQVIGGPIGGVLTLSGVLTLIVVGIMTAGAAGLTAGIITGIALVLLLRQPRKEAHIVTKPRLNDYSTTP